MPFLTTRASHGKTDKRKSTLSTVHKEKRMKEYINKYIDKPIKSKIQIHEVEKKFRIQIGKRIISRTIAPLCCSQNW